MDLIKTRYLIVAWLIAPHVLPIELLMQFFGLPFTGAWWDTTAYYSFYFLSATLIAFAFFKHPPNLANLFGPTPHREAIHCAAAFAVFLWVSGIAIGYVIFFPLSFAYPEFVSNWYLPYSPIVYVTHGEIMWTPTLINLVPLVVFAPLVEEIVFRGIFLRRFAGRYGILRAILLSSMIFGIAHPDSFAATAFGIGMCILYLRYGSLLLTIGVHALWNAACFLLELFYVVLEQREQHYTLEDFHNDWRWGIMFLLITLVWISVLINSPRKKRPWQLVPA